MSPLLAHDTDATVAQAAELFARLDRANVLIKIPATPEGIPAITRTIAAGINVNVTLIFSLERYGEVIEAYLAGLEQLRAAGGDLGAVHSVASFFVSRVDTETDRRLPEDSPLRGQAAVAQRQARLRAVPRVDDGCALGRARRRPARISSGRCGRRRRRRTRPTPRPSTWTR